jgi:hypothetical protein
MRQLKSGDTCHNQSYAQVPAKTAWITVEKNANYKSTGGTNACPYSVGRANWNFLLGKPKEEAANHDEHHCNKDADDPCFGLLSHLQADGPTDFKYASEK